MIYLEECTDKCFAEIFGECGILTDYDVCGNTCPFYKPRGCMDWVRTKRDKSEALYAPEEYERRFNNEADRKHRELYWRIKNVSRSKGRL